MPLTKSSCPCEMGRSNRAPDFFRTRDAGPQQISENAAGLVWFNADGVRGNRWSASGGTGSQQFTRAIPVEIEQEMLKPAVSMRDHQVNQLQIRSHTNDLRTILAQTVLAALTPIHQDVEAVIVLPKRNEGVVIGAGAAAQRNNCIGEPFCGKAFGTSRGLRGIRAHGQDFSCCGYHE